MKHARRSAGPLSAAFARDMRVGDSGCGALKPRLLSLRCLPLQGSSVLPPQTLRATRDEVVRGDRETRDLSRGMGNAQEYFVAGGIAGVVSRTAIAPIERVKILYQVSRASVSTSWLQLAPQIWREEGFLAFWKGNTAAVTRVLPYMSLTFLSYEEYRAALQRSGFGKTSSTIAAGSAAGVTAVALTYPLDLVRHCSGLGLVNLTLALSLALTLTRCAPRWRRRAART